MAFLCANSTFQKKHTIDAEKEIAITIDKFLKAVDLYVKENK
jgi:hypothetical protein